MEYGSRPATPPSIPGWGGREPRFFPGSVADRIVDFLDGRTDEEELLHLLYDHVLGEPVPERMRALLNKRCQSAR
jgi:hypothetical protein